MGLGNGINDYGPSHDTIALSEQQFDNDKAIMEWTILLSKVAVVELIILTENIC